MPSEVLNVAMQKLLGVFDVRGDGFDVNGRRREVATTAKGQGGSNGGNNIDNSSNSKGD